MQRGPVISLITDFGTCDGFVGAMKGRILSILPQAQIFDITHDIPAQSIRHAAFCLRRSAPQFPLGSIHIVVVDPGVGSQRKALLLQNELGWCLAPDNGCLDLLCQEFAPQKIYEIPKSTQFWNSHTSFDGLALFAPAAAHLAAGLDLEHFGKELRKMESLILPKAKKNNQGLTGEIIIFDHFGNAITNIQENQIKSLPRNVQHVICQDAVLLPLANFYAEVNGENIPKDSNRSADLKALINSDNLLELALYQGSIQAHFRLKVGDRVQVLMEE